MGCFSSGFSSCCKQAVQLPWLSALGEIKAKLLEWLNREIQRVKCGHNGMGVDCASGLFVKTS